MLHIGTDEAGYGPLLGPLVVAAAVYESEADRRAAPGGGIADSKEVYGRGGRSALARVLSPYLGLKAPVSLGDLLARLSVRGDPRLLRRMIRNLLENARKHGAPPIKVSLSNSRMKVCDSGAGIPEGEREKVFEPFYRGLGLSIVRQIARRHGGDVRCEGNCFVVSWGQTRV